MSNGSDGTARQRLLDRIGDINDFSRPRPLVTVDEFFTGNDDPASIGYNLPGAPSPAEFHQLLTKIAGKPEVADVRIEVKDLEDEDGWPSTDTIWIATTADLGTVKTWFPERFAPDDWLTPEDLQEPAEPYDAPPGTQVFCAWYD